MIDELMRKEIKILLIDDDKEDFMITRDIIEEIPHRKYIVDWISSYNDALKSINSKGHNVYLIDYRLGARTGLELISEAIKGGCSSPLILLTGQGDMEIDEKAMKAGAADYLVKGNINPLQLERSIRYSIEHSKNLEEITKLNLDLEKRVNERTTDLAEVIRKLEITNDSLKKAQINIGKALRKEKELNELKSRFVTMASHEFRTPLSTILSSASLISKYMIVEDQDKREKHIERIKSAVTNLTGILNDFLSLSQLEEGKAQIKPVEFNLIHFCEEVSDEMRSVAKKDQIIKYEAAGMTGNICVDKHLLKNILINLISNAIKYSPEGKLISLKTELSEKELNLEVKDQGIGIPKEEHVHLFTRFFRANNAGNVQGTGLGLNIVKKYVELLQGSITFSSEINKGTIFYVKIPIQKL
jgi:signal transduction histidine kinase